MPSFYIVDQSQITSAPLGNSNQGNGSQHNGGSITIDANATPGLLTITDNNNVLQDNASAQNVDGDQTIGSTFYGDGENIQAEYTVVVTDGTQNYTLYGIALGPGYSNVVGLAFLDEFPPFGQELTVVSTSEGPNAARGPTYDELAICFTTGALVLTPAGPVPIETLSAGDQVVTRDRGTQVIQWASASDFTSQQLGLRPHLAPVLIKRGAIAPGSPARDMIVSPNHRMLINSWRAEMLFGVKEVLVTASALLNDTTVTRLGPETPVTYRHILFDRHEIITVDGASTESFQPSVPVIDSLQAQVRDELFEIFPDLRAAPDQMGQTARPVLRASEARLLQEAG